MPLTTRYDLITIKGLSFILGEAEFPKDKLWLFEFTYHEFLELLVILFFYFFYFYYIYSLKFYTGKWGWWSGFEERQPSQVLAVQAHGLSVHRLHGLWPKRITDQWCSDALHFGRRVLFYQTRARGPELRPWRSTALNKEGL